MDFDPGAKIRDSDPEEALERLAKLSSIPNFPVMLSLA